jgi:hypothetical protein
MNTKGAWLLAICVFGMIRAQAEPPAPAKSSTAQPPTSRGSYTVETAGVEAVISAVDDGYQYRAYVVRWHGARVLVSDPLAASGRAVGDDIRFIASRHDVHGERILSFTGLDQDTSRHGAAVQNAIPDSSATTQTAGIEEVLSAEEDGYRFTAYLVRWHDTQIGISDVLSRSHAAVGDSISFLAARTGVAGAHLLSFISVEQPATNGAASAQKPLAQPTLETGLVDEVLAAQSNGYRYRAYVVQWHGSRIVVTDEEAATQYRAGDSVTFLAQRMPSPDATQGGILRFLWNTGSDDNATRAFAGQTSSTRDEATVDEVLTAAVDGYRFVAYIVSWHGVRVAICDMFASTHYASGDHIVFPVDLAESSGRRRLSFMLFDFPRAAAMPAPAHAAALQ